MRVDIEREVAKVSDKKRMVRLGFYLARRHGPGRATNCPLIRIRSITTVPGQPTFWENDWYLFLETNANDPTIAVAHLHPHFGISSRSRFPSPYQCSLSVPCPFVVKPNHSASLLPLFLCSSQSFPLPSPKTQKEHTTHADPMIPYRFFPAHSANCVPLLNPSTLFLSLSATASSSIFPTPVH